MNINITRDWLPLWELDIYKCRVTDTILTGPLVKIPELIEPVLADDKAAAAFYSPVTLFRGCISESPQ